LYNATLEEKRRDARRVEKGEERLRKWKTMEEGRSTYSFLKAIYEIAFG